MKDKIKVTMPLALFDGNARPKVATYRTENLPRNNFKQCAISVKNKKEGGEQYALNIGLKSCL